MLHVGGYGTPQDLDNDAISASTPTTGGKVSEHVLKCQQPFFEAVQSGEKSFELRYNDRGFQAGDTIRLREVTSSMSIWTGRECVRRITYVLSGWGLRENWVALSLAPLQPESEK